MVEFNNNENLLLKGSKFIDLFAGMGGFHLALSSLGANCLFASEWDKPAQEVYFNNWGLMPNGDITKIDEKDVPGHDILCAGFPCQAFSISGKQRGFEDSRGTLFFDVARIVKEKKPKVVFLENVKNFETHDNGNTMTVVKNTMENLGYNFFYKLMSAVDYGVPQKRERVYMVCFRNDLNITDFQFPKPIPLNTHVEDYLLEDSCPGVEDLYVNRDDLQVDLKDKPNSNKSIRVGQVATGRQGERVYSPKGVAITLSAHGGGTFAKTGGYLIGNRVRKLHVRECARIMGYPDSYKLSKSTNQAYQQLGNSVVVDVLQLIALEIAKRIK